MDRVVSMAESYFNVSGAVSEQSARFERENAKLREKEAKLNSYNSKLTWDLEEHKERVRILESKLKERESLEASLHSYVDVADLQKAQAESALEAKVHELAQVLEGIPSLEAAVAQRESQILSVQAEAQTVLVESVKLTRLVDLAFTSWWRAASLPYLQDIWNVCADGADAPIILLLGRSHDAKYYSESGDNGIEGTPGLHFWLTNHGFALSTEADISISLADRYPVWRLI